MYIAYIQGKRAALSDPREIGNGKVWPWAL